jgi:uncharacterized membrane protein YfcA
MVQFAGIAQNQAHLFNLLYFVPSSAVAAYFHFKNGYVDKKTGLYAVLAGVPLSVAGSFLSTLVDPALLKKGFGLVLFAVGFAELFRK